MKMGFWFICSALWYNVVYCNKYITVESDLMKQIYKYTSRFYWQSYNKMNEKKKHRVFNVSLFMIYNSESSLGCCKLENEILKEAENLEKWPKIMILRPKNVIDERFWLLSKFNFSACSTLIIIQVSRRELIPIPTKIRNYAKSIIELGWQYCHLFFQPLSTLSCVTR